MAKATITPTIQREVIAKFKKVAETNENAEYTHERIRKTKAHPFEENIHSLLNAGVRVAVINTAQSVVRWLPSGVSRFTR